VARLTELERAGIAPARGSEGLWTKELRHETVLAGLTVDREELAQRIDARVDRMVASRGIEEVKRADAEGASG